MTAGALMMVAGSAAMVISRLGAVSVFPATIISVPGAIISRPATVIGILPVTVSRQSSLLKRWLGVMGFVTVCCGGLPVFVLIMQERAAVPANFSALNSIKWVRKTTKACPMWIIITKFACNKFQTYNNVIICCR